MTKTPTARLPAMSVSFTFAAGRSVPPCDLVHYSRRLMVLGRLRMSFESPRICIRTWRLFPGPSIGRWEGQRQGNISQHTFDFGTDYRTQWWKLPALIVLAV